MTDELKDVYLDLLSNQPKNDQTRAAFRILLRGKFERGLADAVERMWNLPILMIPVRSESYLGLLSEARELFIGGYFYSCVATCGIVGERLVKDMFRASILIRKTGTAIRPTDAAFDQLEHVDVSGIIQFLRKTELLGVAAAKAAVGLGELRNQYAHARGRNPSADAIKSIKLLHTLIEGTVSVFKDFEIKNGVFALKSKVHQ